MTTLFSSIACGLLGPEKKNSAFDLNSIVRPNILDLTPYRCARDDYSEGVLLDANENSLGSISNDYGDMDLHRYPDPLYYEIKTEISKYRNVEKEQIFLGVGSDEAIDILFRIFCVPSQDNIITTPPTYGMYKVSAKVNDTSVIQAPLTSSFDLDIDTVLASINETTKMIFICSPGNPTAKTIPIESICKILDNFDTGLVVVDEAYIDFCTTTKSACSLIDTYPNIVILHTMSKAFGLAAIRLGMAFASREIIQLMNNVKAPYNINKLTARAALDVWKTQLPVLKNKIDVLISNRNELMNKLTALPYVARVFPSDSNFILFRVRARAQEIYKIMAERGVVVRYRGTEIHCNNCIRATVGTKEENEKMIQLMTQVVTELGA